MWQWWSHLHHSLCSQWTVSVERLISWPLMPSQQNWKIIKQLGDSYCDWMANNARLCWRDEPGECVFCVWCMQISSLWILYILPNLAHHPYCADWHCDTDLTHCHAWVTPLASQNRIANRGRLQKETILLIQQHITFLFFLEWVVICIFMAFPVNNLNHLIKSLIVHC